MPSSTPFFPSGAAGAGLVLLRTSLSYSLLLTIQFENAPLWQQLITTFAALGIVAGYRTRFLSVLCLLLALERMFGGTVQFGTGHAMLMSASAIALIGPGAFSVDARLFGRRIVVLPGSERGPVP